MTKRTYAGRDSLRETGQRTLSNVARRWQLLVMILPALIYLILFAYKPMYGIVIAFKNYSLKRGIAGSAWCGLDNFRRLFRSYWFPIILKNTLTLSLLTLALGFPVPIILALMVNEMRSEPLKRLFQTVSYAPHFISTVVVCGMVILFTNPSSGIINLGLKAIGIEPIAFMQRPELFKWVYVLSGIWQGMGWGAIIYFAALSGVDRSLLEAAEIDGANRLQRIIYINFPVLVPTMITLFILQCGQVLNVGYNSFYLLHHLVKSEDVEASEKLCRYLGDYFRYITDQRQDVLSLRQEYDHAMSYLNIQLMRFNNRLCAQVEEVPEACRDWRVPRLILQPLLENVLEHGIHENDDETMVRLSFRREDALLRILVEDNGNTLTDEKLLRMQQLFDETDGSHALNNIHHRLAIFYVYEAMRNGASSYILKTESDQELNAQIDKALGEIRKEKQIKRLFHSFFRENGGESVKALRVTGATRLEDLPGVDPARGFHGTLLYCAGKGGRHAPEHAGRHPQVLWRGA